MFLSWLRDLVHVATSKQVTSKDAIRWRIPRKLRYAARFEQLEDRLVPAASTKVFVDVGPAITNIAAARSTTLPVFIDTGTFTGGAGGLQSGTFYVKYDPAVLSINQATDVKLGAVLAPFSSNYAVGTAAGFGSGVVGVGISHSGTTFYTGTGGGHLVELDFHVLQSIPVGNTTLLDIVPSFSGHLTVLADINGGKYTITPVLTTYSGTLTQPGALTASGLTPADADTGDATIQIVDRPPTVIPTVVNDTYSVAPNNGSFPPTMAVTGLANGVLGNDTDSNGPMNAVLVGGNAITTGTGTVNGAPTVTYTQATANGSVTLNAVDGSFTYAPNTGFTGTDSFTYEAVDTISGGTSTPATVTLQDGGLVSIPQNLTISGSAGSTVTVPVNIANPNPGNSGGVVTITLGINYDPTKFSVGDADVAEGSVLNNAGWTSFVVNAHTTPGRIDITTLGSAITTTTGGDLANITFHAKSVIPGGTTSVINLAGSGTELDVAGAGSPLVLPFAVAPADNSTNLPNAVDGLVTVPSSGPTITVNPSSLTLGTTTVGTAGTKQTYTVSGSGLTAGIVITAPTGVEVSTDGITYSGTLTVAETGGTVPNTTIDARISSTAVVGAITGAIKDTSTGATEADVTVTGTVNPISPVITVTPTSLALGTTTVGTAGTKQTYTVSGSGLTAGIVITAPTGVEVSTDGITYSGTLTVAETGGTVPNTTIDARISSTAVVGAITGAIKDTSTGATEADVTVTGTVNPISPVITVTPTSLALGTTTLGTAGTKQTYTVSGSGLTAGIVITAPTGVEVSTDGITYSGTLTVAETGGTVPNTTIDARISSTAVVGAITGAIKDTSTGATEADVTVTGTVNPISPVITVTPTSLALGTTTVGTAGTKQTYTVSGSGLTAGIVITAPTGVEVSTDGITYSGTLTVAETGGTVPNTTIDARISSTAVVGAITGAIKDTSTGATEADVTVTGTVNPISPVITVTPTSLALGTTTVGTAGTKQTYTVSGSGLTAGIVITAPTGVEVSTDGITYSGTLTVAETGGTVPNTTIDARISSTAVVGAITGAIKDTSTGATEADVTVTGTVNPISPVITVTPTSLALGTTTVGTAGTKQTYTVSGSGLTAGIVITAPTGVEVSTDGITYSGTLTVAETGGTVPNTTIDARISSTAVVGAIIGAIKDTSTGATEADVTVTGTVNPISPVITVTPTSLALGTTTVGTASTPAQTYMVSGSGLTAAITITAPAGVEISSDGSTYSTTLTLPETGGTVASKTIDARISATAVVGAINSKITDISAGTEADVTVTGTVTPVPVATITVNPSSLALGTTTTGTAGTPQTYTVSGTALTAPITITAPAGVVISSDGGASYHPTLTLAETGGTVASTTINARIKATAAVGPITGAITDTSTGAAEQDVTVTGTVNPVGATGTTTTVSTSNATPVYGNAVTLTATVAPQTGSVEPTAGSVQFFINGTTSLGTVTTATTDANHDAIFTYVTTATQLKVDGGAAQPVTVTYTAGAGFTGSASTNPVTETVTPKSLTVSATAANKVYDGTTAATVTLTTNAVAGDVVTASDTSATFADKNVGVGKTVTVSGITIGGADAGNYTLSNTTATTTANITALSLTVTGITAKDKTFDGTTAATLNTTAAHLAGALSGDAVTLVTTGATGTFANAGPGNNIAVTVSGLTLSGADAGNYALPVPQETTTANITPAVVTTVLPTVSVNSLQNLEGTKGLTPFVFQVKLPMGHNGTSKGPATFDVFTTDGTAKAGVNYVGITAGDAAHGGTVTFAAGSNYATVTVYVIAGSFTPTQAKTKTFMVHLSDPANPGIPLNTDGVGTIIGQIGTPPGPVPAFVSVVPAGARKGVQMTLQLTQPRGGYLTSSVPSSPAAPQTKSLDEIFATPLSTDGTGAGIDALNKVFAALGTKKPQK